MKIMVLIITLLSVQVFAQSFTLVDNVTGKRYYCSENGTGGKTCSEVFYNLCVDAFGVYNKPMCVQEKDKTCPLKSASFPDCLEKDYKVCLDAYGQYQKQMCFNNSVKNCK